jgi:hypothetical protein
MALQSFACCMGHGTSARHLKAGKAMRAGHTVAATMLFVAPSYSMGFWGLDEMQYGPRGFSPFCEFDEQHLGQQKR